MRFFLDPHGFLQCCGKIRFSVFQLYLRSYGQIPLKVKDKLNSKCKYDVSVRVVPMERGVMGQTLFGLQQESGNSKIMSWKVRIAKGGEVINKKHAHFSASVWAGFQRGNAVAVDFTFRWDDGYCSPQMAAGPRLIWPNVCFGDELSLAG